MCHNIQNLRIYDTLNLKGWLQDIELKPDETVNKIVGQVVTMELTK